MKRYLGLLYIIFMIVGCNSTKRVKHSFFIAGHAYGNPMEKGTKKGLYKPFKDKFQYIQKEKKIEMGFLLGDVVWMPNAWPEAEKDIAKLDMPIHIVRGNHDGKLKFFQDKFGESYSKFIYEDNLYIILDTNIDGWNISGDQLVFLMNTLRNDSKNVKNIFIFSHHLLWFSKEKFPNPIPNSTAGRAKETNFWSKIEPLLRLQKKPVFIMAGDMGAFPKEYRKQKNIIEYFYHNYDNITFIGTGMGGGVRDNFIIVDVYNDGLVGFRLIPLNGEDPNSLGKLEGYKIID